MPIVGRRRQEKSMLEALRERPDGARELAIHGIPRPGGRRGVVRLVEDQQ